MSTDPLTTFCESYETIAALGRIEADSAADEPLLDRLRQAGLVYSTSINGKRFHHITPRGKRLMLRLA